MGLTNISLFVSLLTLLNPFIIGLIYLNYKPRATVADGLRDGLTICLGSTVIMLAIIAIGTSILDFLGVDLLSIKVAGGIILTLSVYGLMTAGDDGPDTEDRSSRSDQSVITPFVTPICVGGASIALLFTYISDIPNRTFPVIVSLGSAVFFVFLIVGAFLPISVLLFKRIPNGILQVVKTLSLFIVFSLGVKILIEAVPKILPAS
ncbi:MAG: MarC family protein [Actinomycetia bacterium]|nr:MarC family protein [Actinomycetes bacterium]